MASSLTSAPHPLGHWTSENQQDTRYFFTPRQATHFETSVAETEGVGWRCGVVPVTGLNLFLGFRIKGTRPRGRDLLTVDGGNELIIERLMAGLALLEMTVGECSAM